MSAPETVWPCLGYADAPAGIRFLVEAFGFEETLVVRDEHDPDLIHHAELRWPLGGGVMLGSVDKPDAVGAAPKGAGAAYVITDEPDELLARATAAGATLVRGLEDTDYGSRGFTVQDPEGNHWSFGTYRGE